jgi:hypothetical protein
MEPAGETEWPEALSNPDEVRAWIAEVLPGRPEVGGPKQVYQATARTVTAQFTVAGAESVVFKASALDLFGGASRIYELLGRHCAGHVPELLTWRQQKGQTWLLFRSFHGQSLDASPLPSGSLSRLPHTPVSQVPRVFKTVVGYIGEKHAAYWQGHEGPRAELMPLVPELLARAAHYQGRIERWAAELAAGGWPQSLDHPDLHLGNAVLQPEGRVLIYDWEEAVVSCPFFSMDQVLDDVRALDQAHAEAWEPQVRRAYLDVLPWGDAEGRERAFELAMLLLPVKKAYEYIQTDRALGAVEGNRHLTAILHEAVQRWEAAVG